MTLPPSTSQRGPLPTALQRPQENGLGLGRESLDLGSRCLLRHANVVERLQVHPELRARPEPVRETKGGITGDGALAVEIWLMRFAGTRVCRDNSVGLMPSSSSSSASISPGWIGVRAMVVFLSVVVHDLDVRRTASPSGHAKHIRHCVLMRMVYWPFRSPRFFTDEAREAKKNGTRRCRNLSLKAIRSICGGVLLQDQAKLLRTMQWMTAPEPH